MMVLLFKPFSKAPATPELASMSAIETPSDLAPTVGITPPQVLAQQAAAGRRGAAWRLLHWLVADDPRANAAVASLDDDRLARHLLEFIALSTWAGKPFDVPAPLRSPYARMRLRTLFRSGGGIDPMRAERVLTAAMLDSRPAMRMTATSILGFMGRATTAPVLIEALHDPLPEVQLQAAKALGHTRNPAAVPALLSLLQHADEQLSNQVFSSLAQLGPVAVPALIEGSTSHSPWMRWHCIRALGEIRDQRALPVLVGALADTDHAVAWMAAKGLTPFGRRCVGPVLRLLISAHTTPWLVETASYVLSSQHDPNLKPYLEPLLQHMHGVGYDEGTSLYAHKTHSRLIADGVLETGC
jgi:6,7-dimethyl-8-ribityllumazine synthase